METGRALALLAVYMLALLVPLHQAAATQRDMASLGYEAIGSWSICSALAAEDGSGQNSPAVKCPLQALGKQALDTPVAATAAVFAAHVPAFVHNGSPAAAAPVLIHQRGPRAPPSVSLT
ncbi:hypothetical protein [Devosia sp. FKR38]|uniref:hypothetical protein n=1 Tax=Devosia sp. FKR38 TaxID=2562312 RepID=UPI0010C09174|nr:hypothetical protein [Devosia sp. FKR38]